ncbi:hypothetical protein AAFN86_25170 [Roseomonas sp. CAU 1739]|uniref:hypothetical protein n=1 Tax=Roseomonas sp. CAU 1739 TaxID=3140364 RepID=UPI00325BDD0E
MEPFTVRNATSVYWPMLIQFAKFPGCVQAGCQKEELLKRIAVRLAHLVNIHSREQQRSLAFCCALPEVVNQRESRRCVIGETIEV